MNPESLQKSLPFSSLAPSHSQGPGGYNVGLNNLHDDECDLENSNDIARPHLVNNRFSFGQPTDQFKMFKETERDALTNRSIDEAFKG